MSKPLLEAITRHIFHNVTGFHTPGHNRGRGFSEELREIMGQEAAKMDLTELPGLDNLKNPVDCIKKAQDLAAYTFGACATFFLVNGSTVGLQAALLALSREDTKILVTRQAHLSILNGFVLSGGEPLFAPVKVDEKWGIPLGTTGDDIAALAGKHAGIQGVIITQPSYHGCGVEAAGLALKVKELALPLIVDEAHGSHLYFQDMVPLSMQRQKADIVVQSTHKTLGALTQAGMLHVNNQEWLKPISEALGILQTTSPSYLLMASLDDARHRMFEEGPFLVAGLLELADYARTRIKAMSGYSLFNEEICADWRIDPTKLVLSPSGLGMTGWELAETLRVKYGIDVELSDYYYVLFLLTIGHQKSDVDCLLAALREISANKGKGKLLPLENMAEIYQESPRLVLTPRKVYRSKKREVPWESAVGEIAGTSLTAFPPGIPLVWPGQKIEEIHLDYLRYIIENRLPVLGLGPQQTIEVVEEGS